MDDRVFQSAPYRAYGYPINELTASHHYLNATFPSAVPCGYIPTTFVASPPPVPAVPVPGPVFRYSTEDYVRR